MSKFRVLVKDLRVRAYEVEAPNAESARAQVEEGEVDACIAQEVYTESDVDTVEPVVDSTPEASS